MKYSQSSNSPSGRARRSRPQRFVPVHVSWIEQDWTSQDCISLCHDPDIRVQEIAHFSYDDEHKFRLDDSSLRYYYTPQLGADLSEGYDDFIKQDDSEDEHLDGLLRALIAEEKKTETEEVEGVESYKEIDEYRCLGS